MIIATARWVHAVKTVLGYTIAKPTRPTSFNPDVEKFLIEEGMAIDFGSAKVEPDVSDIDPSDSGAESPTKPKSPDSETTKTTKKAVKK